MHVLTENNRIIVAEGTRRLWVEPWGVSGVRVRMTNEAEITVY